MLTKISDVENSDLSEDDLGDRVQCRYINGLEVLVPRKTFDASGKDYVLSLYKQAFNSKQGSMNLRKLTDQMIKTHLIPESLREHYLVFS